MRPALGLVLVALGGCDRKAFDALEPFDPGWVEVFEEPFDGPAGSAPDPDVWLYDLGAGGWGNSELQHYTDRPENVQLSGEGTLRITARREAFEDSAWTSARIRTGGLAVWGYGAFEARMKLPAGKGFWPAFWSLGVDIGTVGWPACGEIDVMELKGEEPDTVYGTLHGPGYAGGASIGDSYTLDEGTFADDFHTFRVEVDPEFVAWFVDGELVQRRASGEIPPGAPWVFDHPRFLLLNVAVGGTFLEEPDAGTPDEGVMEVDYVKVWERATPTDAPDAAEE